MSIQSATTAFMDGAKAPHRQTVAREFMRGMLWGMLPVLAAVGVFGRVWDYPFLVWDDNVNITQNGYLNPVSLANVAEFWREPYSGLYIPLTYTFFAAEAYASQLVGRDLPQAQLDPRVFHVGNLLLHALCVAMIFVILRRLVAHNAAAACGAALFALHPLQTESVAWVTETKGLLSTFLALVALYIHWSSGLARETDLHAEKVPVSWRRLGLRYASATVAFILALLAKPTAVAVPLVALVVDVGLLRRPLRRVIVPLGAWLAVALAVGVITKSQQSDELIRNRTRVWERPLVAGDALAFSLNKLAAPVNLGPDYGRSPLYVLGQHWCYVTWLIPTLVAVVLWRLPQGRVWLTAFGVLVAGLLPVSGLVLFAHQRLSTVADRYLYLPMLGPALAVAYLLSRRWHAWPIAICALLLAACGAASFQQAAKWRDSETLFRHNLAINPRSSASHVNLGFVLSKNKATEDEAIDHYRQALAINSRDVLAMNNLSSVYLQRREYARALETLAKAMTVDPKDVEVHNNMGLAFEGQRKYKHAIASYELALKLSPEHVSALNNLGGALAARGDFKGAVARYREALALRPKLVFTWVNLGNALVRQQKFAEAAESYRRALALNPGAADYHNLLGFALAHDGKIAEAVPHFAEAVRIRPSFTVAKNNLAAARATLEESRSSLAP